MARNIVLLSDGTGNSAAKLFKTNVWRLYGALDVSDPDRQVAYYDNGVGTSSFRPLAVFGGIFGFGLKRNVLDLYRFACRSYRRGDRIFGFGFSRGAFTTRIVAGLIARQGLVPYTGNEAQLSRDALAAYRAFRKRFNVTGGLVDPLRRLRDWTSRLWRHLRRLPQFNPDAQIHPDTIQFLGVWDTVAAYGGPIQELARGIDYWLWPLSMPDRFMSAKINRACHALALDDARDAFWPVLWNEDHVSGPEDLRPMAEGWSAPARPNLPDIDRQRLSQVWFAGMHSDVGGGYAQDGLSYVALDWMIDRAVAYDLLVKPFERARIGELADKLDKLNDSRHGLGGYYRYKPRKLVDVYGRDPYKPTIKRDLARAARLAKTDPGTDAGDGPNPIIHESVFQRIAAGLDGYSPIVLPETYRVTTRTGAIRSAVYEHPSQATKRARRQERAWNWVWLRRVVYFATVFASLFLVAPSVDRQALAGAGRAEPGGLPRPDDRRRRRLLTGAGHTLDRRVQGGAWIVRGGRRGGCALAFLGWGSSTAHRRCDAGDLASDREPAAMSGRRLAPPDGLPLSTADPQSVPWVLLQPHPVDLAHALRGARRRRRGDRRCLRHRRHRGFHPASVTASYARRARRPSATANRSGPAPSVRPPEGQAGAA